MFCIIGNIARLSLNEKWNWIWLENSAQFHCVPLQSSNKWSTDQYRSTDLELGTPAVQYSKITQHWKCSLYADRLLRITVGFKARLLSNYSTCPHDSVPVCHCGNQPTSQPVYLGMTRYNFLYPYDQYQYWHYNSEYLPILISIRWLFSSSGCRCWGGSVPVYCMSCKVNLSIWA